MTEPTPAPTSCPRCGCDLFNVPRTDAFCSTTKKIEPSFVDDMTINCAECGHEMEDERPAIIDAYYEAKRLEDAAQTSIINPEILKRFREYPGNPTPEEWRDEWLAAVYLRNVFPQPPYEIMEAMAALLWWDRYGRETLAPPKEDA